MHGRAATAAHEAPASATATGFGTQAAAAGAAGAELARIARARVGEEAGRLALACVVDRAAETPAGPGASVTPVTHGVRCTAGALTRAGDRGAGRSAIGPARLRPATAAPTTGHDEARVVGSTRQDRLRGGLGLDG
jgi:hypothetical protein